MFLWPSSSTDISLKSPRDSSSSVNVPLKLLYKLPFEVFEHIENRQDFHVSPLVLIVMIIKAKYRGRGEQIVTCMTIFVEK